MITLEEIANRLIDKKEYNFNVNKTTWEPKKVEQYTVPTFSITESKAKGAETKLRNKLSKVLAFVDVVKHKRYKVGCTIMPISVTSKDYLAIWGNEMNVSRAIEYMKEIGLISLENDKYQFGAYYEKDNKSKVYRYYKENEDKIKEYCQLRGIEKYLVQNVVYSMAEVARVHSDIDRAKVRFSSKMKLIKPADLSKAEFEKQLTLCLYENYPALQFHIMKANEINDRYYKEYPEFRISFQPNFTWADNGLYVSRIGIRATNSMCNMKKEDREEILKAYGFHLKHDINASVPRMTLSLNSGAWVDETEDLYGRIFRVLEPNGKFCNETREAIKKLHMRAYFDSTDKLAGHHTWLSMNQENLERQDVCDKMAELREAIIKAEGGKLYGSDIFYVESCVYLMTLYDLLASGHKVWQVYDCFYSTGQEDQETFDYMISSGVKLNFLYFIENYWN